MNNELYYLMKKNLLKLGAPIEGIYEGETLKEEESSILLDGENEASEYLEYFGNLSDKILVFHIDLSQPVNSEFAMFVQDSASRNSYGGGVNYRDTVLPISILKNKYVKLNKFIQRKCTELGISMEEVIVIIMNSGGKLEFSDGIHRSPLFFLHDIAHNVLGSKSIDSGSEAIYEIIEEAYFNAYEDENGVSLDKKLFKGSTSYALSEIMFADDVIKVTDPINHLFSLSLSKKSGYLEFRDKVYLSELKKTFYKKEEYQDVDVAGSIEELILPYMEEKMNSLQGKIIFLMN